MSLEHIKAVREKFNALMDKRKMADDMTLALLAHPRFRETGDGIFEISERKIQIHVAMCEFITAARQKYPLQHMPWHKAEFNQYDENLVRIVRATEGEPA